MQPTDEPSIEVLVPDGFRVLTTDWLSTRIDGTSIEVHYGKTYAGAPQVWFDELKLNLENEFYVKGGKPLGEPVCSYGDVDVCWGRVSGKLDGSKQSWLVVIAAPPEGGVGTTVVVSGSPEDLSVHSGQLERIKTDFRRGSGGATSTAPPMEPIYSGPPNPAMEAAIDGWAMFDGPVGFRIRMPDQPTDAAEPMDTPLGSATMHTWGASTFAPVAYYMVSTTDYPVGFVNILGVDAALDAAMEGMVKGSNGTLLDQRRLTFAGQPTRRFTIKAQAEGFQMWMIGRIFIVGDRVYIVAVSTTDATAEVWADRWMDTLAL